MHAYKILPILYQLPLIHMSPQFISSRNIGSVKFLKHASFWEMWFEIRTYLTNWNFHKFINCHKLERQSPLFKSLLLSLINVVIIISIVLVFITIRYSVLLLLQIVYYMYQNLQKFDIHWHGSGPSIAMIFHLRRVSDLLYGWMSCLTCYMKDV